MSHSELHPPAKRRGRRRSTLAAALAMASAGMLAGPGPSIARDGEDVTRGSLERLLSMQVSSASTYAQKLREAPAAVTNPTSGDIRNSGDGGAGIAESSEQEGLSKFHAKAALGPFKVSATYSERNNGLLPDQLGSSFNTPATESIEKSTLLDLTHSGQLRQFALTTRVFYGDYNPAEIDMATARGRWWGTELKAAGTVLEGHKLAFGTVYQNNTLQHQLAPVVDRFMSYRDEDRHSQALGVYLQDEYALRTDVTVTAGVRYNHSTAPDRAHVSPRIALIYKAADATTARLLYGRAFRNPNTYESFYSSPDLQIANPDLRAERSRSVQALVEHQPGAGLKISAGVFESSIDGVIQQAIEPESGLLQFQNQPKFDTRGARFEVEGHFRLGVKLLASYTRQYVDSAAALVNAPGHLAKVDLSTPLWSERFTAGVESRYTGSRLTTQGEMGGFAVANLTVRYRARSVPLELSASAYNLFDRRYADFVTAEPAVLAREVVEQGGRTFGVQALFPL